jgi:hypothetical protein
MKYLWTIKESDSLILAKNEGFFFNFCQVGGGVVIIHKRNEPNLAKGQTGQQKLFGILPSSGNLHENSFFFCEKRHFKTFFFLSKCVNFLFVFFSNNHVVQFAMHNGILLLLP